jgi:ferredoxin
MRLEVDWTRCDGHGMCARLLPERIDLDQEGFPVIARRDLDATVLSHARRAVGACPRLALRLDNAPAIH